MDDLSDIHYFWKMKNSVLILILLFNSIIFQSCKDDELLEPDVEQFVEETRLSGRERIVLNCKTQGDVLITKGIGRMDYFFANGEHKRYSLSVSDFSILHKPPVYKNYYLNFLAPDQLYLQTLGAGSQGDYIKMKELDSTFSDFLFVNNWVNECILFADTDIMWVAYLSFADKKNSTRFLKVKLKFNGHHSYETVVPSEDIMPISSWYLLDNELYVSNGGSAYKVSENGLTKEIIKSGIFRMFELDDILWAVNYNDWIYFSNDNGDTWELFSNEGIESLSLFCLENIDGRALGYWRGGLIEVSSTITSDGSTTLSTRMINTDGMGNAEITSLAKFNGRYYIGTYNGLFSKSEESFFTYVE